VIGPTLQEVQLLSVGDNMFLPCYLDIPSNIYPVPDHIEWWRDGMLCSTSSCGVSCDDTESVLYVLTMYGIIIRTIPVTSTDSC